MHTIYRNPVSRLVAIGFGLVLFDFLQPSYASESSRQDQCMESGDYEKDSRQEYSAQSLGRVYHGGQITEGARAEILCMTEQQWENAETRYLSFSVVSDEYQLLKERYGDDNPLNKRLKVFALRDSDGDGILDYRIKKYGSFMKNDPDADNDGIDNLFDPRPLSADPERDRISNNDDDNDGIPNHLDWSNKALFDKPVSRKLIKRQSKMFSKFGIVLITANGSEFTQDIADMSWHGANALSNMLDPSKVKNPTISITLEEKYGYQDLGVLAEVSPVNGQFVFYTDLMSDDNKKNRIVNFLTFVHEYVHIIQNWMDQDANESILLKTNVHEKPESFISAMSNFGWEMSLDKKKELKDPKPVSGFVDHENEAFRVREVYRSAKSTGDTELLLSSVKKQTCDQNGIPKGDWYRKNMEWDAEGWWRPVDETWEQEKAIWKENYEFWYSSNMSWDPANKVWQKVQKTWKEQHIVSCYSLSGVREWHAEYIAATLLAIMYEELQSSFIHAKYADSIIWHVQEQTCTQWGATPFMYKNIKPEHKQQIREMLDLDNKPKIMKKLLKYYLIKPYNDIRKIDVSEYPEDGCIKENMKTSALWDERSTNNAL